MHTQPTAIGRTHLTVLPGGAHLSQTEIDEQETRAWSKIGLAITEALSDLDPAHPERPAFLRMLASAGAAAGFEPRARLTEVR